MAEKEKTSRLKEIKETALCVVEIMRQIRIPEVQESFGKIMNAAIITKGIIDSLKTSEMVKNIENFRLISENMNEASTRMQNTLKHIEETGIINETKGLVTSAKNTMDLFACGQDLHEMSTAAKEILKSVRVLVDELRITICPP